MEPLAPSNPNENLVNGNQAGNGRGSNASWSNEPAHTTKEPKKRRRLQKKAPGAPKRGKSPYILFSMEKRNEIKAMMPPNSKVTDVMRAIADAWAKMTDEEKLPWKTAAEQDKQRYEEEMASYDGPLRVPNKRAKKHPDAPKRASSAFLFYSQVMRPRIKAEHPEMKNTEISKQLGEAWSKATDAQKAPFVQKEKEDRDRYKREMEEWNNNKHDRELAEAQRQHQMKQEAEQSAQHSVDHQDQRQFANMPSMAEFEQIGYPSSSYPASTDDYPYRKSMI